MASAGTVMASAGTVTVDFAAETARFRSQIGQLESRLKKTEGAFTQLGSVARAGLAFLGGAAILGFVRAQANAADELGKVADRLKDTTESLRAYQIASQEAGVAVEQSTRILQDSQKRLGEAAAGTGEAAKFIKQLGLNIEDLKRQSPTELFRTYSEAINSLSSRSEQLAAANALMGRSAIDAFNLIQAGSPALEEAAQFTERFGLALDRVSIKQIEAANDTIGRLSIVSEAAAQRIFAGLSPALEFFANKLLDATGNTEGLQRQMELFGSVAITAFEVVANGARVLEATFFSTAAAIAKVLQALTLGDVSASFAASAESNYARAEDALQRIKSIAEIQETVVSALEDSKRRAEEAVAAQLAADAASEASGVTLGESPALETAKLLADLEEDVAKRQEKAEKDLTKVIEDEVQARAEAARNLADYEIGIAQRRTEEEIALRQQAVNAGIGAIRLLATNSKTFGKIAKALDIAAAIRNTYVAVTNQLKSGDPYSAIPRALAVGAFGAAQISAIARTPNEASFGSVTTISGSGGPVSGVSPVFGGSSDDDRGAQSISTVQVIIQGNLLGNREFLEEMINGIKEEINDKDVVIIQPQSRQAQELVTVNG